MTARLTVLASGSSGNATLLQVDGFGLLIDCGLNPRMLSARLTAVGASWDKVNAVVLTHTHGDHWKDLTLAHLRCRDIPVYAHPDHLDHLNSAAPSYPSLRRSDLARTYTRGRELDLAPGLTAFPVWVSHDSEPTFAFRLDYEDADGLAWSVGYASDLGCGSPELVEALRTFKRQALHAEKLEFVHPVSGETITTNSALPADMQALLAALRGDTANFNVEHARR